ncbi:MAG: HpcH/HpaI aldolase/citrate lyase family protein [Dichotomicrobium sp.]
MITPRRSVLYMPGSNPRAHDKARSLPCDGVLLDLEDAVAPEEKERAREQALATLREGGFGPREVILRTNALDSPWGRDDLIAGAGSGADAILLPKVEGPEGLAEVRDLLSEQGAPAGLALWAMIETPLAVIRAPEIAAAGPAERYPLTVFVMGTNDLAKETRAAIVPGRAPMLPWLSNLVLAARAYGVEVLDGVYNTLDDPEGFAAECAQGRELGMDGKTLIHPSQIAPCNAAFSPSDDEVADAREIIAAFEKPENAGKGAITVNGRMVERLHAEMARRTVALADAIAARAGA